MNRIIIIGGMGPQASLELHKRLLSAAARSGAQDNDDFPEILHVSIPVPDFISGGSQQVGLLRLERSLKLLQFKADDKVVLACNTAHLLLPEIEAICGANLISLIDVSIAAARKREVLRIGILASPTTIRTKLYERPLRDSGIEVVLPTNKEMAILEAAIREVIANKPAAKIASRIQPIICRMLSAGADGILLGCTELSVIFSGSKDEKLLDPLAEVSKRLIEV